MNKDNLLRLLVVDTSRNDAERLVNDLKGGGYAVRYTLAEDDEDLTNALAEQAFDLVVCSTNVEGLSVQQAGQLIEDSGKELPLIAMTEKFDIASQVKAMTAGARDLVSRAHPDQIKAIVHREMENLQQRLGYKQARKSLAESEKRCRLLIDSSRDAITYIHEGMHIHANSVYLGMFGYENQEELEGTPIMDMVAPEDHAKFKEFIRNYAKTEDGEATLLVRGMRPDGSYFNAQMEFSPASISGEACTQIIIRDQADSKELEKKIKHLSKQDLLTGLYNRQYFLEEVEQVISKSRETKQSAAVLYILLDNFRTIKDTVGLAASDLVISDIAGLLRNHIADSDVAARFSDSSFTILTDHAESAKKTAEVIRKAVEEHICDAGGQSLTATVSIGISIIDPYTESVQTVLTHADVACEKVRSKGGNAIHQHDVVSDAAAAKACEEAWTGRIRKALDNDGFHLVYQPIVCLQSSPGERYEVYLRMDDESEGVIMPEVFLPSAMQSGLITAIDRWVIERSIRVIAEHKRITGKQVTFFVKLTGPSLSDETLLPWINERLKAARLPGDCLTFEISEATAAAYLKDAKAFSRGVKELRCGFAIEHFGLQDNGFQLVKHITTDYLKIDGSLMHKLAGNNDNQEKIKSIAASAQEIDKVTIAEFVEDASSLSVLWQLGVKFIQGNFLQEPHPLLDYEFSEQSA